MRIQKRISRIWLWHLRVFNVNGKSDNLRVGYSSTITVTATATVIVIVTATTAVASASSSKQ